jgi:hypothetical protein
MDTLHGKKPLRRRVTKDTIPEIALGERSLSMTLNKDIFVIWRFFMTDRVEETADDDEKS